MTSLRELLIVCVLFTLASFGAYKLGHVNGAEEIQRKWDTDQANLMAANDQLVAQHAKDIERIRLENQLTNEKVQHDHENALKAKDAAIAAARTDADSRGGLRIPVPTESRGSVQNGPATETKGSIQYYEAAPTTVELPRSIQDSLWAIIDRAEEVTEQAKSCQAWIRKNGFYDEPVDELAPSQ